MKVLKVNERFLRLSCLFPPDQLTVVEKIRRYATICVCLTILLWAALGTAIYVYFHLDKLSDCIIALA